ncbi:3-oxoacyl-[acyl-carrier-protein] synthase 3 [Alistipes sp. CAG:831]|nr:3-oxoacyl-[acyl-carrier-protein] synthase 3 [Alistipes sp. CAG:831]
MAFLSYRGVGVLGMSACVPKHVIHNYEYTEYFPSEEVKEVVDKIGIKERRFVDENTCSSDLCYAATEKLISDLEIDRSEIDVLLFVSQTPDYRMPATSVILQDRLGLSKKTMALDINLGCSGFIYGLCTAYAFAQQSSVRKVLLLDGETRSKVYSPKDRKTAFLFGDGGVAAIIEKNDSIGNSYFSMNSDGSRESYIKIDAGGYRHPSNAESVKEKIVDKYGNIRSDEQGYMKGSDVFNFVIKEIPADVKAILEFSGEKLDSMDYYIFHQANNFMNSYLIQKLGIDKSKVPSTIAKYGNVSSVSVPLTIVSELRGLLKGEKKLMLSAFGVGMTWAHGIVPLKDCFISEIVEL